MAIPQYQEFSPSPVLARHVRCLWTITGSLAPGEPVRHRVLPDGCLDLILNFGTPMSGPDASPWNAFVVGADPSAIEVAVGGEVDIVGVRFRPGAAFNYLGVPAWELTGSAACVEDLWGSAGRGLFERVAGIREPGERWRCLESFLAEVSGAGPSPDAQVEGMVERIYSARGDVRVADCLDAGGRSGRTLERAFLRHVGLTAKTLSRIVRFRRAAGLLRSGSIAGPADAAVAAGYHDQAHLTREFKAMAGLTPGAFRREAAVDFLQDRADEPEQPGGSFPKQEDRS